MRLRVQSENPTETTLTLRLRHDENDVIVEDADHGWDIVSLRVVNGKLSLVRYTSINEPSLYNLDEEQRIELAEE